MWSWVSDTMKLDSFSASYDEARDKFLRACGRRDLAVQSHLHPMTGRDGETLAIDVARLGPTDAENLLVVSSGCHGIEGFCGSAVQIDLLRSDEWHAQCQRQGLAVLYLHALNPYGFSWERRVTHENVDLNRNFRDFSQPLPENTAYTAIAPMLMPKRCPPTLASTLGILTHALRHGRQTVQAAISAGQNQDPSGLFYGGQAPTWSNLQVRQILREHGQRCRRIGWIDVHTGLGPSGIAEYIYKGVLDEPSLARARQWWGPRVTSSLEGDTSSSAGAGMLDQAVMAECPQAQYNGMTLEYGTVPGRQVLNALRAEQWLENHPQTGDAQRRRIKQALRAAFYVETDDWKQQVLTQAREVMQATLAGLSTPLD